MTTQQSKWDNYFFEVAIETARLSHGIRLKTGAVAVRDKRIVCCGFNGTAPGRDNNCEYKVYLEDDKGIATSVTNDIRAEYPYGWTLSDKVYKLVTKEEVLHAEQNLISYAARHGIPLEGCSIYITHMPCLKCASMILSSGIKKVYYISEYRLTDGVEYLQESGIEVIKRDNNNKREYY